MKNWNNFDSCSVLLPGGSVWFDDTKGGYVEAGRLILDEAETMNANGDFFPVWGTCLGLELMTFHENGGNDLRVNCSAYNEANNVIFTPGNKFQSIIITLVM